MITSCPPHGSKIYRRTLIKLTESNYFLIPNCLLSIPQDYFEIMWLTALEFKPEQPWHLFLSVLRRKSILKPKSLPLHNQTNRWITIAEP